MEQRAAAAKQRAAAMKRTAAAMKQRAAAIKQRAAVCSAAMSQILLAMVLGGVVAAAQGTSSTVKDDLFNGTERFAKGASDVTEVTMDPDTLGMVSGDNARRAHGMVLNVVRTYEYDKPGMYNVAEVEEFRKRLDTGDWHCSVHTRSLKSGESTDICSKHRTDGLVEQAIITVAPKELTFIHTIRRGGGNEGHGGPNAGESMFFAPEIPGLSGWDAASQARFAAMEPMMAAKFASMGPVMEAKLAAMGPVMAARLAGESARVDSIRASEFGMQVAPGRHGWTRRSPAVPQPPTAPRPPSPPPAPAPPATPEIPDPPQVPAVPHL